MSRFSKAVCAVVFFCLFYLPSALFAADDLYDAPGFNANRSTVSSADFEHIDPFTGGLIYSFEDMRLPGNGGLDLVIQRTFNSKNVCRTWAQIGTNPPTCPYNFVNIKKEDSWAGLGWTMHMGKLYAKVNLSLPHIIEMPDGSQHEAYNKPDGTFVTKDYWQLQLVSGTFVATLTDGKKITYGHFAGITSDNQYNEYYATKIQDSNGNTITITYYEPDGTADRLEYYAAIRSITDSAGRITTFNLTPGTIAGRYRLASIQRPDGKFITFAYTLIDTANPNRALLTTVQPPEGNPWQFSYNTATSLHEPSSVTTPYSATIQYVFGTTPYNYTVGQKNYRTVNQKTVSGREITTGTWNFSYFQGTTKDYTIITDSCGRTTQYRHYGYSTGLVAGQMWMMGLPISKEVVGKEAFNYTWARSANYISADDYQIIFATWRDTEIYVPYQSTQTITRGGLTYTTTYGAFDSYGNPKSITETGDKTRSRSLTYWYNTAKNIVHGKPLTETITGTFTGSFTTSNTYDTNTGNLLQLSRYGVITKYGYFTNGNLYTLTDPLNNVTSYQWTNGKISRVTNPLYFISRVISPMGTITSETNGRGYATGYTYDGNLRLTGITPPLGNPTIITYPYDSSYKKQTRGGYSLYTYYDGIGRPSGTSDSKGVITDIVYKSCGLKDYTTSNIGDTVWYDNFGRISFSVHKDNKKIIYTYTGHNVKVTDEDNYSTYLNYNAFSSPEDKMLMSVKDPANTTTTYTRNILGSLTNITLGTLNRTFVYDTKNFLTSETHPEAGAITYTRDAAGNMKTRKDAALVTRTFTYDSLNRLTAITNGTETLSFGYDNADNRVSMSSPSASATFTYDAANLLLQKAETIAGMVYTTGYDYDDNDNPILLTYPSGLSVTYGYNTNNQTISATGFGGSVTGITYNTAGLPTAYSYTNGINTVNTYNNRNLTTRLTAGTASDTGYTYDFRGNTKTITDYLNTARNQSFTYDSLSRLLTAIGPWGTDSYAYNTAGDRTSKTVAGLATNYTYTSSRLTSATGGEAGTYSYNANGSLTGLTQGGAPYTIAYDWMHNTTSYKAGTTTLASFTYDGDGTRVTKTGNGTTTVYHTDKEGRTITETDASGNLIADYLYVNGKLAAKKEPTSLFFYHTDPAGTPLVLTDSAGAIAWKADYKPFGEEQITAAVKDNYKMFVGKEKDKETGLYYFGARYMQDKTARFVSVDPVGPVDERSGKVNEKMLLNPQKINRYAYAINNPYRYVDPDGKWPEQVHNTIISRAFGEGQYKLPASAIAAMQRGSKNADSPQYQDNAHSYMHAMRAPGQSAEEAAGLTVTFINQQVGEYRRLIAAGQTDKAYEALGMAMHPLMDNTSPSHEGFQEWSGMLPVIPNAFKAISHGNAESEKIFNSNTDFSTKSVNSLRNLYDQTNK